MSYGGLYRLIIIRSLGGDSYFATSVDLWEGTYQHTHSSKRMKPCRLGAHSMEKKSRKKLKMPSVCTMKVNISFESH